MEGSSAPESQGGTVKAEPRRRGDRIFGASYVEGLESVPTQELRRRKIECEEYESELSYARRLLQGKLDILSHELERRAAGGESGIEDIIKTLPRILAEGASPSLGRLPRIFLPKNAEVHRREIECLVSEATLARIDELSSEELAEIVESLTVAEKEISHRRRRVQQVMDAVSGELVRRYREGQEDPTVLLTS